jgi:hypothetical protein
VRSCVRGGGRERGRRREKFFIFACFSNRSSLRNEEECGQDFWNFLETCWVTPELRFFMFI